MFKSSNLNANNDLLLLRQAKGCAIVKLDLYRAHAEYIYWLQQEFLVICDERLQMLPAPH
jgi:hypothetical protein